MATILRDETLELGRRACETNDITLLNKAFESVAAVEIMPLYEHLLRKAISSDSMPVIVHLITSHGVLLKTLPPLVVGDKPRPSIKTLELLLAHGWDINYRTNYYPNSRPFLWWITSDLALVKWCLAHGASIKTSDTRMCDPILETAARYGKFAAFKLLRSKGAPPGGRRTLHRAIEGAAVCHLASNAQEKHTEEQRRSREKYDEYLRLVRYLIDVVGLDVNAPDWVPGDKGISGAHGTPICYVTGPGVPGREARELTWLLLDKGADPTPALEVAKELDDTRFVEYVEDWQRRNGCERLYLDPKGRSQRKCCVQ